jgi:hypothetical protein
MNNIEEIFIWIIYILFFLVGGSVVTAIFYHVFGVMIDIIPLGNLLIFVASGSISDYYFYKFTGVAPKGLMN